jgi:hypothetical protein
MKAWLWGVITALVAAVAAVTVIAVLNSGGGGGIADPRLAAQESVQPRDCVPGEMVAIVYFDTDEEMTATAERLREEPSVAAVQVWTKAENFEHFKELFKDQPELVELARVEAIPASIQLLPVGRTSPDKLIDQVSDVLPADADAQTVPCKPR